MAGVGAWVLATVLPMPWSKVFATLCGICLGVLGFVTLRSVRDCLRVRYGADSLDDLVTAYEQSRIVDSKLRRSGAEGEEREDRRAYHVGSLSSREFELHGEDDP